MIRYGIRQPAGSKPPTKPPAKPGKGLDQIIVTDPEEYP